MTLRSTALESYRYGDPARVLEIEQERKGFEDRLANWRRVARDRGWESATCWSAEGRYVAPRDEIAAIPEPDLLELAARWRKADPWPADPDVARGLIADAWLIEDTWRFLPNTPRPWRQILALAYHRRGSVRRFAIQLGVRRDQFDDVLRKARAMLRNRLRTLGDREIA